jgi:hypothetical protein
MVGMVIVGGPQGGDGAAPPTAVESQAAAEKLGRLLETAEIAEPAPTDGASDVVGIPPYEFSAGESYTFETFLRTNDGTLESTETWEVTAVDGDDVTVAVTSAVDGETTTRTLSGTQDTIYDVASDELSFNFFSIARAPLRIAEMGELTAGNSFTIRRSQFPNQDTINWQTATVDVGGETSVNGVACTEFTVRPDGQNQVQTACVADGYPFAVSLRQTQGGTRVIDLTLTGSTRP